MTAVTDDGRLAVVRPAVHDAMADRRRQLSADLLAQERNDLVERRRHVAHFPRGPRLIDEGLSLDVFGEQARARADALDLPFHAPLEPVMGDNSEQLKLDARAAGVEHKDGFGHGSGPDRLFRPSAVREKHGHGAGRHARSHIVRARGQYDGHPCAEHDAGRIGSGEERQVLGEHVAGFEVGHDQDLSLASDRRLDALDARRLRTDRVVEGERAIEFAAGDLAAIRHFAERGCFDGRGNAWVYRLDR